MQAAQADGGGRQFIEYLLLCSCATLTACGSSATPETEAGPGSVSAAQTCTLRAIGIPAPPPNQCWQLTYRTTDTSGAAVDTIATVLVPDKAPAGDRVLVSYQTAEDSLSPAYAPSVAFTQGAAVDSVEEANVILDLARGWVVVVPDYEGPQSQFGAGIMAGHAVLDGIRAAENFAPAGLAGLSTKVGMEGYSGGALATGHAMELQGSYAPELNIVGVAEGGVPADLGDAAKKLDGGPVSGLELLAAIGIKRAYQYRFDFESALNEAGKALELNIGDMALTSVNPATNPIIVYPFKRLDQYTTIPNLLDYAPVAAILDELKMGHRTPVAPSVFMFNSIIDELIPIATVDALYETYCRAGVHVSYERTLAGEHGIAAVTFFVQALPYLQGVFSGTPRDNPLAKSCN